ncbi:preprotein translocase subunit Sec61beta [Candidatus Pacearchaeota archaeon]|nr:preprotein translocase subunit Sec61beta [Candidatus Pacearchaeota archaeon]
MAQQPGVQLPAGFGGLTRFKEEYESLINLKPEHVIAFVVLIVVFRIVLSFWFS